LVERTILEEHAVAERHGLLGGKEIASSAEGQIERLTYVPACDFCGRHPLTEYSICRSCGGKLCSRCGIEFCGRHYCRGCLIELLPISRNTFKVMLCIMHEKASASKISSLTRIPKQDIRLCLALLSEMKLVETKGLSVFSRQELTAEGVEAVAVFRRVYGADEDMQELETSLNEGNVEELAVGI